MQTLRARTTLLPCRLTIGLRLGLSFGAILALFAVALLIIVQSLGRMADAEREVAELDRAKRAGHRVAALVREQYIHQAHTIIEGNRSHLDHYQDVAALTRTASDDLEGFARSNDERSLAMQIGTLARKNHDDFMNVTVPAIDRGEHETVLRLHAETERVVGGVAKLVKSLVEHFEAGSDAARARADGQRRRVRVTLLGCFGAAAVVAAVLGGWTTRSIASRLRVLRLGAQRLGDGDLSRRIALGGEDELAELAASFDEMASRLERHQEALVQSQKLASIGRLCAGVAHEINGPLGIILGYAKVIRQQGADDEALSAIEDEAKQCQRIVEALLDVSRHDVPRFEAFDLAQLARDGVERLRATGAIGARRVTVEVAEGAAVLAFGDEAKLRQVVLNLLRNALDVTPDGGTIVVGVRREARRVLLTVADHGPGISAEMKERLFEPFFTTKPHGTGLGLAIARAIVEAHRGSIRLASSDLGGARVEVELEEARRDVAEALA